MGINKTEFVKSAVAVRDYPEETDIEFAFIGRSNVGKSSLINSLTNRRNLARTSKTPGRTQLINYFKVNDYFKLNITEHLVLIKDCVYLPLENFYLKCNIGDLIIMIDTYNKKVLSIDPSYTIKVVVRDDEIYTI